MESKKCTKCGEEKLANLGFFYAQRTSKDKLRGRCRICSAKDAKNYKEANREKINKKNREWRQGVKDTAEYKEAKIISDAKYYKKNKERIRERNLKYYQENKDTILKQQAGYQIKWRKTERGSEWTKQYQKNRIINDENYRLIKNLRSRLWYVMVGKSKSASTIELLGCSIEDLKTHLEKLFQEGMTWENYGNPNGDHTEGWHVDHIRPCASFDLSDPIEQRECFYYTNLQPLWGRDNLSKGDKWDGQITL